jgi:hypothetical protein
MPSFWMTGSTKKSLKGAASRNKFSKGEDDLLRQLVTEHGDNNWPMVAAKMKSRTARQCRERYNNYLSPRIANGPWTPEEDQLLALKFDELGSAWARIARSFDRRSDVNVKNRWTTLQSRGKFRPQPCIPIPPPFFPMPTIASGYFPFYYPPPIYPIPLPIPRPPPMRTAAPAFVKTDKVDLPSEKGSPVTQGEFENMDDPWSYDNAPDTSYTCWM